MEIPLFLADYYDGPSLAQEFQEMLQRKFEAHNILEIHDAADIFNVTGLKYRAAKFMIRKFSELMLEPSFKSMDAKLLEMCIIKRGSEVRQIDVFNGLIKWSEVRCKKAALETSAENKRNMLGDIFHHIQFARISVEDFLRFVVPSKILTTEEKLIVAEDRILESTDGMKGISQALDSDVQWTRGSVRNETPSRRRSGRSALFRQYHKSHLAAKKFPI